MPKKIPIWNVQYSGLNWLFENKVWIREKNFLDLFKVKEGVILNMIVNMASIVEGSLRNYIISEIEETYERISHLQSVLQHPFEYDLLNEKYNKVQELLKEEKEKMNKFLDSELLQQVVYEKRGNMKLWGLNICVSLKRKRPIKKVNRTTINLILTKIQGSSWSTLTNYFNVLEKRKISSYLKEVDTNLVEDIEKLFQLRNFVVHSNFVEIELGNMSIDHYGKLKSIITYLKKRNVMQEDNKTYIIDQVFCPSLLNHFREVMQKYFQSGFLLRNNDTNLNMTTIYK